jgi:hypothetical protein
MPEEICLHNVTGIFRFSGVDHQDNQWVEFEVDYLAEQEKGICVICGAELKSGWLCLNGGDEVCDKHILFYPDGK